MAVDSRQQQQMPFASMGYDSNMRYHGPAFSNPWVSAPASTHSQMYATSLPATSMPHDVKQYNAPATHVPSGYSSAGLSAPVLATGMLPLDPDLMGRSGLRLAQDMSAPRPYGASYATSAAPPASSYAPTSAPQYTASYGYQLDRRTSHPLVASNNMFLDNSADVQQQRQNSLIDYNDRMQQVAEADRQGFSDAIEASRGMVAMSQSDITPRNIYGINNNGSTSSRNSSVDSYGFPSSHSAHSSISGGGYGYGYPSSVSDANSVVDYSSASESVDMPSSRTLPRPNGLIGGALPPAPQSMMGQFSSKVSSSSQKKHKCKICDKRFTRPSSLQTHMYSHTGEKPFACEIDNCGRQFSVVSNLRRHRKVHRGEGFDHASPEDNE
ncbi:hypothetical protein LTR62_002328 [Meristemomyces frigidus]|uniref:C2H2-type domain-containing protein n=1 Tax=Meristemomyces frigidus TaxID=1508187 RepID=A0AAN7T7K0_9PEZI|nr:hypothetical protein LTR62_002328 [Meristemomyces frigidus]